MILFFSIFSIASCKLEKAQATKDDTAVQGNEELSLNTNRDLNSTELSNAYSACEALESYSLDLRRAVGVKYKYNFQLSGNSCTAKIPVSSHSVYATAPADQDEELKYYPLTGTVKPNFYYPILSNESKYLKNICEVVIGFSAENKKLIQKIGNEYVKFRFFNKGGLEYFIYKNIGGKWISRNFESYEINTDKTDVNFGMVKKRTAGNFCSDNSQAFYRQELK